MARTGAAPITAPAVEGAAPITARAHRSAADQIRKRRGGYTIVATGERDGELAAHCGVWVAVHEQEAYR